MKRKHTDDDRAILENAYFDTRTAGRMVRFERDEIELCSQYLHVADDDDISIADTVRQMNDMPDDAKLDTRAVY